MNREIKFRGFWKDIDGKLHYKIGNLNIVNNKEHTGCYISNDYGSPFAYKVIPETIGQYTGLKDKNGKEIYEGDICIGNDHIENDNEKFIIKYGKYKTDEWKDKYSCNTYQFGLYAEFIKTKSQVHLVSPNGIEVIGNIYESEVTNAKD